MQVANITYFSLFRPITEGWKEENACIPLRARAKTGIFCFSQSYSQLELITSILFNILLLAIDQKIY